MSCRGKGSTEKVFVIKHPSVLRDCLRLQSEVDSTLNLFPNSEQGVHDTAVSFSFQRPEASQKLKPSWRTSLLRYISILHVVAIPKTEDINKWVSLEKPALVIQLLSQNEE